MLPSTTMPANWTRVTADQLINDRPTVLYGVQVYVSGQSGGTLIIRDGLNANAPIVFTMDVNASQSKNVVIDRGILLTGGLFVDVTANITECTVAWLPFVEPVMPSVGTREVK